MQNQTGRTGISADFSIEKANDGDSAEVFSLLRSLVGTPGCSWDEYYPSMELVRADIAAGAMFIIRIGGAIAACASVESDDEISTLDCFDKRIKNPVLLCRVASASAFQRRGLAHALVRHIIAYAPSLGADGVILLAAKNNIPALNLYKNLGFEICGECVMYDTDWYCMQLIYRGGAQ